MDLQNGIGNLPFEYDIRVVFTKWFCDCHVRVGFANIKSNARIGLASWTCEFVLRVGLAKLTCELRMRIWYRGFALRLGFASGI